MEEVKGLDNENLKTKEQDIEGDSRRWEDFPCPQIERTNIVKMKLAIIAK